VTNSILNSIKKVLNVPADNADFDQDILMHNNSVFSTLSQLGVGPDEGFRIDDQTTEWSAFLNGDNRLNNVKSYMYLRVRLLFDPPGTSFHITALEKQVEELTWRINLQREDELWTEPAP
jgi:hypothetical protein